MVDSTKCNCCLKEDVCGIKKEFEDAIETIQNNAIPTGDNGIKYIKDCDKISVNITCKAFVSKGQQLARREIT